MRMTRPDIDNLRSILSACRIAGIDSLMVTDGLARGAVASADAAIITESHLTIDKSIKLGIGRIAELEKRISVFSNDISIEGKVNDSNEVIILTISAGEGKTKSSIQFRCTADRLLRYPKSNEDDVQAIISMSKAEVNQLTRGTKSLNAEGLILKIARDGTVGWECFDATNDKFAMNIVAEANFANDAASSVYTYQADRLITILDNATREAEDVQMIIGEIGSITLSLKGHTLLLMPQINGDEDE